MIAVGFGVWAASTTNARVIRDPTVPSGVGQFAAIQGAAVALGVNLVPVDMRSNAEIDRGVTAFARQYACPAADTLGPCRPAANWGLPPSGRIDSRRALWVGALERRRIERAEVSRAVDEANSGHRSRKVKQARQPVRRCDQTPRVGTIRSISRGSCLLRAATR
jgi:hypothetical protein